MWFPSSTCRAIDACAVITCRSRGFGNTARITHTIAAMANAVNPAAIRSASDWGSFECDISALLISSIGRGDGWLPRPSPTGDGSHCDGHAAARHETLVPGHAEYSRQCRDSAGTNVPPLWAAKTGVTRQYDRLRAVFEGAAKRFGWGIKPAPSRGLGIAGGFEKGGYVAACAEVAVDPASRTVRIARVVEAWDCGPVINPNGLKNQIEGAIVQAIGGALFEDVHFANGRVLNPHFSSYRVPRFRDLPSIEVEIINRKERGERRA